MRLGILLEECESGRIGTLGKRVNRKVPWVRIPPPPQGESPGQNVVVAVTRLPHFGVRAAVIAILIAHRSWVLRAFVSHPAARTTLAGQVGGAERCQVVGTSRAKPTDVPTQSNAARRARMLCWRCCYRGNKARTKSIHVSRWRPRSVSDPPKSTVGKTSRRPVRFVRWGD